MDMSEYATIIFEAQKAEWKDNGLEHFIWRLTQMLDHDLDEDDLQEYRPKTIWINKKTGKEIELND